MNDSMQVTFSGDKFFDSLSFAGKQEMLDKVAKRSLGAGVVHADGKVWHGYIQECPACKALRVTSCCTCGCGNCLTCGYQWVCGQSDMTLITLPKDFTGMLPEK